MSYIARLRRNAGRALGLAMASVTIAIHALFAAWFLFAVHPVAAILSGVLAAVVSLYGIGQSRECLKALDAIEREERHRLQLPKL